MEPVTLELETYIPGAAEVKSDLPEQQSSVQYSNFTVKFQVLYEVHGDYKSTSTNDASLVVFKIIPESTDPKQSLLSFDVTLTILPDGRLDEPRNVPILRSYEPNSAGAEYIKVRTTNETLERTWEGNAQLDVMGFSPGIKGSRTKRTEFEKQHVLQIESGFGRSPPAPLGKTNEVWWRIRAADIKDSGIGDSFTVALLIRRPATSSFQIMAKVDGEIGNLRDQMKRLIPSGFRSKKNPTVLGTYGPRTGQESTEVPNGIDRHNLSAASKDDVMKSIKEIGLHLPEEARLANFRSQPATQTVSPSDAAESATTDVSACVSAAKTVNRSMQEIVTRRDDGTVCTPPHGSDDSTRLEARSVLQRESGMARMERHRKMAALYERLAELHREEARQYLPQDEVAYARQVENGPGWL
ncbi:predicted protein [Aspergillus terreus NIH2624]|uniref:Uncharacterized protein n=1 Tax=Aspergillus terreus (strain NIH 2624 / FGSC A1156) TaxID=341663 RepID=Q0CX49_ASPTN|nr:uncharacterized protein ATEG_01735 [Aspergillus terreus NIH2624]EAU38492.1 predicted protein [Aspergillus terreus NIH2624]